MIEGESVPADQKVVSIFEPHTDIIRRGKTRSPTEFGHKLSLSTGSSGLVTQYQVCEGNPGDGDLLPGILDKHLEQFGRGPGAFAGDRRFYSEKNEKLAGSEPYNVEYVSIPKPGRRTPKRKAHESEKWFKILQRFRAGIEGILSCLLRALGLTRCLWKGRESFGSCWPFGGDVQLAQACRLALARLENQRYLTMHMGRFVFLSYISFDLWVMSL